MQRKLYVIGSFLLPRLIFFVSFFLFNCSLLISISHIQLYMHFAERGAHYIRWTLVWNILAGEPMRKRGEEEDRRSEGRDESALELWTHSCGRTQAHLSPLRRQQELGFLTLPIFSPPFYCGEQRWKEISASKRWKRGGTRSHKTPLSTGSVMVLRWRWKIRKSIKRNNKINAFWRAET